MHYSSSDQLQEQVEGILELVIQPCLSDCRVHGPRHGRVIVGFQQETVSRRWQQGTQVRTQMRRMWKGKGS
jgi:hypothetical protein